MLSEGKLLEESDKQQRVDSESGSFLEESRYHHLMMRIRLTTLIFPILENTLFSTTTN
jgi:hypothetical protein